MPILVILLVIVLVLAVELTYYIFLIPDPSQKPLKPRPFDTYRGRAAYIVAYILSLLRTPLGLLPYLVKLFIFFALRVDYETSHSTYLREVINMLGDFVNLGLTTLLVLFLAGPPKVQPPTFLLYLPLGAELVRLIVERTLITFSALWQLLPHRRIAHAIPTQQQLRWVAHCFTRYCRYYALSDSARTQYILHALKHRAKLDRDVSNRLEYIRAFRIIPQQHGLRGGRVRDVAQAEVFIHNSWTNDPWLLVGMALRRAPWMFDPRYLHRPPYYMTETNPTVTLFVLEHARYSPPYAAFQFGHEIRVARLHFFYGLLRRLGFNIEEKVLADGTFQFDQLIYWLNGRLRHDDAPSCKRYLYTDEETIADILSRYDVDAAITAEEVAAHYTYPLKYVEEVLLQKICQARATPRAGASDSHVVW
jgi:hypothetical protein